MAAFPPHIEPKTAAKAKEVKKELDYYGLEVSGLAAPFPSPACLERSRVGRRRKCPRPSAYVERAICQGAARRAKSEASGRLYIHIELKLAFIFELFYTN